MQWHKAAVSWFGTAAQKKKASSYPKHCSSALVFGDCRQWCSGTRLLSAGVIAHLCTAAAAQSEGRQLPLKAAAVHWCLVTAHLYAEWISIGVNAVAQGCCQLVWHSSTEGEGRQLPLKAAVVHWCLVTADLYAQWISIGVNAVAQSCCQLVWHSSTEGEGRQLTLVTGV